MYHPSLARANDGTWRLVFQVNDRTPMLATAYSRDLVTWRPQDYPRMTTRECLKPVVFANASGAFDIYFLTKGGEKRWVEASADFRHFAKDERSLIDDAAWTRDTATVGGVLQEGCLFDLSPQELQTVKAHFEALRADAQRSSERMHDDAQNPDMPRQTVTASLSVTTEEKAISGELIGVFFEDISYAADGGLYAELIQNRDFEYAARDHRGWGATTAWHASEPINIVQVDPLSPQNPHYAVIGEDTLYNEGWDGIAVAQGAKYDFSMFVQNVRIREDGRPLKKDFIVQLTDSLGTVIAQAKVKTQGEGWQKYEATLTAKRSCDRARLAPGGHRHGESLPAGDLHGPQERTAQGSGGGHRGTEAEVREVPGGLHESRTGTGEHLPLAPHHRAAGTATAGLQHLELSPDTRTGIL